MRPEIGDQLTAMAALTEPLRRALYLYVVGQRRPVGRAEAAAAEGVSRTVAAFHLDRLVDAGLLEVTHGRTSDRRGPGAGRPAILYRRAARPHELSIPPRDYALAAQVLVDAVEEAGADQVLYAAAEREGVRRGRVQARERAPGEDLEAVRRALDDAGYEPRREGDELRLLNCPFHDLSRANPPLVCGMNLALLTGLARGLQASVDVRLDPRPGACCVAVSKSKID